MVRPLVADRGDGTAWRCIAFLHKFKNTEAVITAEIITSNIIMTYGTWIIIANSRENPGKNLNQVTCPDRDSNPGHLVSQPDALTVTP
ncbi:hypothetical protein ANN_21978 [Periplaneta americana]|uniref:Uncharacterized protein n=1 Tax=Periplaneta americana TaxID=6978 RepID=A0ABQ8S6U6_PERAM|nr:hypothetical protein ANN_21978 [Periplaneta americana]